MAKPRSSLKLVLVISFALKLTSSLLINLFNCHLLASGHDQGVSWTGGVVLERI